MLSIWKRTWKQKGSSVVPLEGNLTGLGSDASLSDIPASSGSKPLDPEHFDHFDPSTRLRKRVRLDLDRTSRAKDIDAVSEAAEHQNTIIILSSEQLITTSLNQLVIGVVRRHRVCPILTPGGNRTAFLIVNDNAESGTYESSVHSQDASVSIAKCGIGDDPWVESWDTVLQKDVVIMTCDDFLRSLVDGTFAMTQVHTLIFCNIMNAQGHLLAPIRRIMDDFYSTADNLFRPRVYGLAVLSTAFRELAAPIRKEIETSLEFKIVHLTDHELKDTSSGFFRPHEVVLTYKSMAPSSVPILLEKLKLIDPLESSFPRIFCDSREVLNELGPCASDLVWRRAMKDLNVAIYADSTNKMGQQTKSIDNQIRDEIKDWTFTLPSVDPGTQGYNISPKFSVLLKALDSLLPYGDRFRGIVMVRGTAIALAATDLLRNFNDQPSFFRPVSLPEIEESSSSTFQRQETLRLFSAGLYNLLIISDLDQQVVIPNVSAVICLDDTLASASMRKLKRNSCSHLIHIVEDDRDLSGNSPSQSAGSYETPIPDVRQPAELDIPASSEAEATVDTCNGEQEFIQDPTAGGRIYRDNSEEVINRIATRGLATGSTGKPVFLFDEQPKRHDLPPTFTCIIVLPGPFKIIGPLCTSKDEARSAACFTACQTFYSLGALDYRFFPAPPAAQTLVDSADEFKSMGTRQYSIKKPDFWVRTKTNPTKSLFPMIISTASANKGQHYSSFAILTRQPLPDMANFNIFFSGIPAPVSIKRGAALQLEEDQLNQLYFYTLRLTRIISNKPFDCSLSDTMYFFAPLAEGWTTSETNMLYAPYGLPSIVGWIPWDLVRLAGGAYHLPLQMTSIEDIEDGVQDAVIQDRSVEFTRRYYAIKVRRDLSPLSKPIDSAREEGYSSILAYCKARRKDFEGLEDENQPLIEVSAAPMILNQLNPAFRSPILLKPPAKYLIPALCSKSVISASALRTALLLPSVMQRIDDLLLVKELNARLFDCAICDKLLHMALCTPSSGIEYDYERLELLGDAFLKYISSIYVFVAHPIHAEGFLHTARQDLISNRSLFRLASRIGLPHYIQSKVFSPKQWRPPNFVLPFSATNRSPGVAEASDVDHPMSSSKLVEESQPTSGTTVNVKKLKNQARSRRRKKKRDATQWLGDKALADVAEAIIGAGYISGGQDVGLKVAKALGIPFLNINCWVDFSNRLGSTISNPFSTIGRESIQAVQSIIGYEVESPSLLAQALTHSSTPGHDKVVSERLEFIGDAIIDFMVVRHIYDQEQQLSPGGLTLLKGAMVSNSTLAAICVCSGLHEHLLLNSHTLSTAIQEYVVNLKAAKDKEYQNAAIESRSPGQFWLELSAPKALSDIVESITGVVFVTDRFSSIGIEALYAKLLEPFYDQHISLKTLSQHPTKILFEIFQRQGCKEFKAETETKERKTGLNVVNGIVLMAWSEERAQSLLTVLVHNIILASAEDLDVNIAARRASLSALDALDGDPGFFARSCNCRVESSKRVSKRKQDLDCASNKRVRLQDSELEEGMIVESEREASEQEEGIIID